MKFREVTIASLFLAMIALISVPAAGLPSNSRIFLHIKADGKPCKASITVLPSFGSTASDPYGNATIELPQRIFSIVAVTTFHGSLYAAHVSNISINVLRSNTLTLNLLKGTNKPGSLGAIHTRHGKLYVNGKQYQIKGIGYEPTAIGTGPAWRPIDDKIYKRDFSLMHAMHANTIRTWGEVDHNLLNTATRNSLKVIAGFWVLYEADLSNHTIRARIIADFRRYVNAYKSSPAILMWSIGNEQNYHNGSTATWYSLLNEMAWTAWDEEGDQYHPVTTPNGDINNIGHKTIASDDNSLLYLDVWGANIYRGSSFGNLFESYAKKSRKPFWISEYGADAYDQQIMAIDEDMQSKRDIQLWTEINVAKNEILGATLMAYSDQWWKNGSPDQHNPGGFHMSSETDGVSDEEFWGIVSIDKNKYGGIDLITPRKVYYDLMQLWVKQ